MTRDEYEVKYQRNTQITGYGFEVVTHLPCPACAITEPYLRWIRRVEPAHGV